MFFFACVLFAVAGMGIVSSVRAAIAQVIYCESKYGWTREDEEYILTEEDEEKVFSNCERAFVLYPHNYSFCTWTSEMAWYGRHDEDGAENPTKRAIADQWCQRGLALNSFDSQLRMLEVNLLIDEELKDAIRKLEAYVEWNFWEPYNHAFLAELYARDGRYGDAIESLLWVKGSRYERDARQRVRDAWTAEIEATATPQQR